MPRHGLLGRALMNSTTGDLSETADWWQSSLKSGSARDIQAVVTDHLGFTFPVRARARGSRMG